MNKSARTGALLAAIIAAGIGGHWIGQRGMMNSASTVPGTMSSGQPAASGGRVLYYRDPDGPFYAAEPKLNPAGKVYLPVLAGEDISFDPPSAKAEASSATKMPGKIRFYRNPMGLPDTSPVPKKDSMGMDYIPVFEGEDDESSVVKLAPGKVQRTGVRSVPAKREVISHTIHAPGIVTLDERRVTVVAPRVDSFVDRVEPITTGDRVSKGQRLAELYAPELAAAAAQFVTELASERRAGSAGGARRRLENLGVPQEAIAGIERTQVVPRSFVWRAPRDGVLIERNTVEGMKMSAGAPLFRIADLSALWVLADVPEAELSGLKVGDETVIRLRHRPDLVLRGQISLIYPQVNMETRTARVRIEAPNPDGVLLPNMFAGVEIKSGMDEPLIAVPENAVIDSGTRRIVILDRGEGRFEPREVRTGTRGNGLVAILDGVTEGDRVVTSATFLIDAESNLRSALQAMARDTAGEKRP